MPGRNNRVVLFLAILLIVQGALSSAWAASRCVAMGDCAAQASSPCPMGSSMGSSMPPCDGMSGECGQAEAPRIICEEGCARVFSDAPAVLALSPDAPPASAARALVVVPADALRASVLSGAALAPFSRGKPALYLATHSLLI